MMKIVCLQFSKYSTASAVDDHPRRGGPSPATIRMGTVLVVTPEPPMARATLVAGYGRAIRPRAARGLTWGPTDSAEWRTLLAAASRRRKAARAYA
jgi:hypothetical protein